MLVRPCIAVKMLLAARSVETEDFAGTHQQIKITVHRTEADARHAVAYHAVNFVRSGMGGDIAQCL